MGIHPPPSALADPDEQGCQQEQLQHLHASDISVHRGIAGTALGHPAAVCADIIARIAQAGLVVGVKRA